MDKTRRCPGYIEEVSYIQSDRYINVIKSVETKWCPLRNECYRYLYANHRRLLDINVIGNDCPYFVKIDEDINTIQNELT